MKEFWIKQSNSRQFHGGANRQGAWSDDEEDWEAMLDKGAFDDAFSTDDTTSAETSCYKKATVEAAAKPPSEPKKATVEPAVSKNKFDNKILLALKLKKVILVLAKITR